MPVETVSGEREPTDWDILTRWWRALDESNAETRDLRLALRIIFMLLVLTLAANVAFADVYAYSSASDCEADRDANPKARYVATYGDEWALIADKTNNYTFYSLGGKKCFRVSPEHRATLDGALTITGTRIAIAITASGVVVAQRIKAAVIAVAGWFGWDLLPGDGPSQFTIDLAYSTAADRLRDPCKAIVSDLASNNPTGWGGAIDYSGMYSDCLRDNPVTTGPANRVEIPRPATPSTDYPGASNSEIKEIETYVNEWVSQCGATEESAKTIMKEAYAQNGMNGARQRIEDCRDAIRLADDLPRAPSIPPRDPPIPEPPRD